MDVGGRDLRLTLGIEQYARLELIYGLREDGVHPLGLNLHDGGADRIRTTISHLDGNVINFNVVMVSAGRWSMAGENVVAGEVDFRFADFSGPGGQDFRNVDYIVFIFQTSGSFTLNRIETVAGGLFSEPDIEAIGLLPRDNAVRKELPLR